MQGESYATHTNKLKEQARAMLLEEADPVAQLHLIDALQRLGVSYHFEDQIQSLLRVMHRNLAFTNYEAWSGHKINLDATALQFRLLRQHGYWVPQGTYLYLYFF